MIRKGSCRRVVIGGLALVTLAVPIVLTSGPSSATPLTASNNAKTLSVSLPGPFNGCSYLDPGATPTSNAILDLVRPSAFLTNSGGNLYGENGPIASAELISLSPETVHYAIAAKQTWSNGHPFTGNDLVSWWLRARTLASVVSDGYRSIKTLSVSRNGLLVTATFTTPYADWNSLFRDVEALGSPSGCDIAGLVARPSLGPYLVKSATSDRVVLVMNNSWPTQLNRFGRIVFSDTGAIPSARDANFLIYSLTVNRAQMQTLSSHPTVLSRIGSSSNLEEVTFSPTRPFSKRLPVREALSWSIARQAMINRLWGAVTFSPSVAASALYSQGQLYYPGTGGSGPTAQTTTTTSIPSALTNGLTDCLKCALQALSTGGFHRTSAGWFTNGNFQLSLRMAVGPSSLDEAVAAGLKKRWSNIGIPVTLVDVSSEMAAALVSSIGSVDLAVFLRPTNTSASYSARSWAGPNFSDTYPSGWRQPGVSTLFNQAIANFNPVTAASTWLSIDKVVSSAYWVRPLFTPPSLIEWSSSVAGVNGSTSVPGLLDQLPAWSTAVPPNPG